MVYYSHMSFVVQLVLQFVILVAAMVVAGLIIRWIAANPQKWKSALKRIKRFFIAPVIWMRSYRAYRNWKKVGMGLVFQEIKKNYVVLPNYSWKKNNFLNCRKRLDG